MQRLEIDAETLRINYWKSINRGLDRYLQDLKGIVLLIHNSAEIDDILSFLKRLRPKDELDILYISLVRSFYHIKLFFDERKLDKKRLHVLDCVSSMITDIDDKGIFRGEEDIEAIFRRPPSDFHRLEGLISEGLDLLKKSGVLADMVVVDSISQLINLTFPTESQLRDFYSFLNAIRNKLMGVMHDTFILLYDDKIGYVRHIPIVHADHIIRMEVIREKPSWRG